MQISQISPGPRAGYERGSSGRTGSAGWLSGQLGVLAGLAIMAGVAFCFASLATWSVDDPSLSNANSNIPHNAGGFIGSTHRRPPDAVHRTCQRRVPRRSGRLGLAEDRPAADLPHEIAPDRLASGDDPCGGGAWLLRAARNLAVADRPWRRCRRSRPEDSRNADRPLSIRHPRHAVHPVYSPWSRCC